VEASGSGAQPLHATAHLLAQEKVLVMPQRLGGVDRIMISHRDQTHAARLQSLVDLVRIVITFAANPVEQRDAAHSGVGGVDVQIAAHAHL
jgi:hypothetical protein